MEDRLTSCSSVGATDLAARDDTELVGVADRWCKRQLLKGLQPCKTMNSEVAVVLLPLQPAASQQWIATSLRSGVKRLDANMVNTLAGLK